MRKFEKTLTWNDYVCIWMYMDAFIYLIIHYLNLFIHSLFYLFYFIFTMNHLPRAQSWRGLSAMHGSKLGSPQMTHLRLNWQGLIYQKGFKSRMRERSNTAEASSPLFHVQSRLQALNQTISSLRHQKSLICVFIIYFHS